MAEILDNNGNLIEFCENSEMVKLYAKKVKQSITKMDIYLVLKGLGFRTDKVLVETTEEIYKKLQE